MAENKKESEQIPEAFKRQFIISGSTIKNEYVGSFNYLKLAQFYVYYHSDCEYSYYETNEEKIVLFGYALHCDYPDMDNDEIVKKLIATSKNINELSEATYPLGGRWAIMYQNPHDTYFLNDATGLKQLFYSKVNDVAY